MNQWAQSALKLNKLNNQNYLLQELIEDADNSNLKVLVVISPYRYDYVNRFLPKEELFKSLYDLKNVCNFDILDMYNNEEIITPDDFYDADHLNKDSARKLSDIINIRLEYLNNI